MAPNAATQWGLTGVGPRLHGSDNSKVDLSNGPPFILQDMSHRIGSFLMSWMHRHGVLAAQHSIAGDGQSKCILLAIYLLRICWEDYPALWRRSLERVC